MFTGKSDLNTNIVFSSDYDTNQYDPSSSILLYTLSPELVFFLSNIISVFHSDKRRTGRHNYNKTFVIIADHTFGKIKEDTCRETKICQNLLQEKYTFPI